MKANKKKDEKLQIDLELTSNFESKSKKRINCERKTAKRLKVSYQKYFLVKNREVKLL